MLGDMKVLVDGCEQARRVDHRECIGGLYVDVPELAEGEELFWTVGSRMPMIVTVRKTDA